MSTEWRKLRRKFWSVTRGLTKFETEILECLARYGPLNVNQTKKKLSSAYSSTRKAIFSLVGKGIVVKSGIMTVKHTGLETPTYDLTLKGVLLVLKRELPLASMGKWNIDFIRRLVRKYDSLLPLIFGKWNHFNKMAVEKTALIRLSIIGQNSDLVKRGNQRVPGETMEQKINWLFYVGSLYEYSLLLSSDPVVWVKAWKEDEDMRAFGIREIQRHIRRYEKAIVAYKKYLSSLKGAKINM
jgi:hypothetical protein